MDAVIITTVQVNIIDAQGSDTDIILKGTDGIQIQVHLKADGSEF